MSRPTDSVPAWLVSGLLDVAPGVPWVGPVEAIVREVWTEGAVVGTSEAYPDTRHVIDSNGDVWNRKMDRIRLPLTRPEGRAHLARVLTVGERCERCAGHGEIGDRYTVADMDGNGVEVDEREQCGSCEGTGYLRKPAHVRWMLAQDELGDLPPERAAWSAGLLACSAHRMAAGLSPVLGVLESWGRPDQWIARIGRTASGLGLDTSGGGRLVHGDGSAALAAGFALANPDGTLTLPWPDEAPHV